jgi:hypothetical protein
VFSREDSSPEALLLQGLPLPLAMLTELTIKLKANTDINKAFILSPLKIV